MKRNHPNLTDGGCNLIASKLKVLLVISQVDLPLWYKKKILNLHSGRLASLVSLFHSVNILSLLVGINQWENDKPKLVLTWLFEIKKCGEEFLGCSNQN